MNPSPTRSPWTHKAFLRSLHIVPDMEEREALAYLSRIGHREYMSLLRGAAYGLLLSLVMFAGAVLWCCL